MRMLRVTRSIHCTNIGRGVYGTKQCRTTLWLYQPVCAGGGEVGQNLLFKERLMSNSRLLKAVDVM